MHRVSFQITTDTIIAIVLSNFGSQVHLRRIYYLRTFNYTMLKKCRCFANRPCVWEGDKKSHKEILVKEDLKEKLCHVMFKF